MRTLLAFALLFGVTACSKGKETKSADEKKEPAARKRLAVGDPAPPLAVTKWLKGGEIKAFEPGKVYVVDFWATWCGPCIQSMPHLNELQHEYKDQLTAVAVTTKDEKNSAEAVEKFVTGKGAKYDFGFAFCDTQDTWEAYMTAADQDGIPCSFVIDKAGKVAFVGHPMELDDVLPKVVAGTWKGKDDVAEINTMNKALEAIYDKADQDPDAALTAFSAFETKYPTKAKRESLAVTKVMLLLQAKKYDDAKALTEPLLKTLTEKKSGRGLNQLRAFWAAKQLNPDKKHIDLALKAAEAYLAVEGDKDPMALSGVAEANFAAGNKEKAVEYGDKAVAAAEDLRQKEFLQKAIDERYKK